jgi:hypothetical protein
LAQRVGAWSRARHEEWIASVARRREAVRRGEAEQTGGVVAQPIRMAEPSPVENGQQPPESPPATQVAEVESLLRRVASHERDRGGGIPSLARTGQAPSQPGRDRGPGTA